MTDHRGAAARPSKEAKPPSLADPALDLSWTQPSGLHSTLFSTAFVLDTVESFEDLVDEWTTQSRASSDPATAEAYLVEAARVLIERLGRREEAEALLRRFEGSLARQFLDALHGPDVGLGHDLATLEEEARAPSHTARVRADAWVEFGLLCEQHTPALGRALEAYRAALALVPDHPEALQLAAEAATLVAPDEAPALLESLLRTDLPVPLRVIVCLERAEIEPDERRAQAFLSRARAEDPNEETTLRRLIRWTALSGDTEHLGDLYLQLARIVSDPIARATALHLSFLALSDANLPVQDVVAQMLTEIRRIDDPRDMLAPLSEVALYLERQAAMGRERPLADENEVLGALWPYLDDVREQALVREQLARRRAAGLDPFLDTGAPQTALDPGTVARFDALEEDLDFCLRVVPDHHWANHTRARLLEARGRIRELVKHLGDWARIQPPGPGRARIFLELGRVHEQHTCNGARAAEVYELALAEHPDDTNCLRALGRVYETTRKWPQAVAILLRQAEQIDDPLERPAVLRRVAAIAERELRDTDLAITALEQLAEADPEDTLALFRLAALARASERPTVLIKALRLLTERIDDPVLHAVLLVELGSVHESKLRRRLLAREYYERALDLSPAYTPAARALLRIYRDEGDVDAFVALCTPDRCPHLDPALVAYMAARFVADELGVGERVVPLAKAAYEANPDLVAARELYIDALAQAGAFPQACDVAAAADVPAAAAAAADHHYRVGLLAEAAARAERGPEAATFAAAAVQHHRQALRHQPDHGLAAERARRIFSAYGDLENLAAILAGDMAERSPRDKAAAIVQIARVHLVAGSPEQAKLAFERAYGLDAEDPLVARSLETMLQSSNDAAALPTLYITLARATEDRHLQATLLVEAAESLLDSDAPEDRGLAASAVLDALRSDPGNPYAVRHLERILADPAIQLDVKDAVSARAVRAQSDAERATFYLESAELLERAGLTKQARRAYLAALDAVPGLMPAQLGLARIAQGAAAVVQAKAGPTSIHALLADLRGTVSRVLGGDTAAFDEALTRLQYVLSHHPGHRDALAMGRALLERFPRATELQEILARALPAIERPEDVHALARALALAADDPNAAVAYLEQANAALPGDVPTLRDLVAARSRTTDLLGAIDAREQLIEALPEADPSRADLHLDIARELGQLPEHLDKAIAHAERARTAAPRRPDVLDVTATLYERADRVTDAVGCLLRLLEIEQDRNRRHDLLVRLATLESRRGKLNDAIDALERAAALRPGKRETLDMLVDLYERAGRPDAADRWVDPTRSVLLADVARGALSVRSVGLLIKMARHGRPDLTFAARMLGHALAPGSIPPPNGSPSRPIPGALLEAVQAPVLRAALRTPKEPPALDALLVALERASGAFAGEFGQLQDADEAPLPPSVDARALAPTVEALAKEAGLAPRPDVVGSLTHNAAFVIPGRPATVRIGTNLWLQGDLPAFRALLAVALARQALGAGRVRGLAPVDLDLLLAAAFEVSGVFHPLTADPDAGRLRNLAATLDKELPRRLRKEVTQACEDLASHSLAPLEASRIVTATDLRVALLLLGDAGAVLDAAALLDAVVGATRKTRINRSALAQGVVAFTLSPEFAHAWQAIHGPVR